MGMCSMLSFIGVVKQGHLWMYAASRDVYCTCLCFACWISAHTAGRRSGGIEGQAGQNLLGRVPRGQLKGHKHYACCGGWRDLYLSAETLDVGLRLAYLLN